MLLNTSREFENLNVLETQTDIIKAQLDLAAKKEVQEIANKLLKLLPSIQIQIRKEVFQSFKLITGVIIEQEFVKVYGHGFDLSSLQHSLIYIHNPKDFEPDIDYNPNIFRFNDKLYRDLNKFNQNARKQERKNRKYIDPGFYTDSGDFANFYDDDYIDDYNQLYGTDTDDYIFDLKDFDNFTFTSKRNPTEEINLASTYNKAISKAKQGFRTQWISTIKPRLEKVRSKVYLIKGGQYGKY